MSFELPGNLPQLSQVTKMLTQLENPLEKTVGQAGLSLPKGPQQQILQFQRSVEAGRTPSPPNMNDLNIPSQLQIPNLPQLGQLGQTRETRTATEKVSTRSARASEPYIAGGGGRSELKPAIF